ncbi:MAG: EAL domain-containing protein [Symploca sp. SIO2B6]|nr:EAL domain-containing protein [Symploca sp. SIO2B6]
MPNLPGTQIASVLQSTSHHLNTRRILSYGKVVLSISLATTGVLFGIRMLGWLQPLELKAFDQMMRRQNPIETDDRILVVGIEEGDILQYGWPISDDVMATLLAKLQAHNPTVIGLDLHREISHPPGTEQLRSQLANPNVIVIEKLGGNNAVNPPSYVPLERVGFNNLLPDFNIDSVIRRNLMAVKIDGIEHYSLAVQLSRIYLQDYDIDFSTQPDGLRFGNTFFQDLGKSPGSYQNLNLSGYQLLARYHSDSVPGDFISLRQVLKGEVDPTLIRDKIILIGTVAPSIKDTFDTPHTRNPSHTNKMAGVVIHAHLTSHILRTVLDGEQLFWFIPDWAEGLWMLGWAVVGGSVTWIIRNPTMLSTGLIGSGCLLIGGSYLAFLQAGWVPLWPPLLALGITSGLVFTYKTLYKLLYDTLTGLPQKNLFLRSVERALRPAPIALFKTPVLTTEQTAILCLDLSGFKRINESLGHEQGDRILLVITRRLKTCLPRHSQLSRFVGDKFAARVSDLPHDDDAIKLARAMQDSINQPIPINNQEIVMSASIGIAFSPKDAPIKANELLRNAQTAMHQAKSRGKSHIEVFTDNMRLNIIAHFQTEADLRYAIERQELRTYYQPFISLQTGNIAGFEALIRWQHPEHGLVSPGKFISVAEDTDLIIPIGQWILQEACQKMQYWHTKFPGRAPLVVSVNLSGRQFTQPDLVKHIEKILAQTGLNGRYLKLELTESILMDDVSSVIETLHQMKKLDLQISIDDFGTGYSSLSYLHRFPIDTLKVDRSFVMNIDEMGEDHAIVKTIIALGHHLGMDVIAEGIETSEQAKKLKDLHCEYGQGYFFAKPLPAEKVEELLVRERFWLPPAEVDRSAIL